MNITKLTTLFFFFALSSFPVTAAGGDLLYGHDEIDSSVGFQGWYSMADAKWRISFPYTTGTGATGKTESELTFKKIDSPLIIATGSGKLSPLFSFDLLYGYGSIRNGRGTDTDRFLSDSGGGIEFSQSRNDLTGDVRLWEINLYYNNKRFADKQAGPWGLVLGFFHYEDSLKIRNGIQTVSETFDGISLPQPGPFPGLDSTYDFFWNALKAGVLRQAELTKSLSYTVALSLYPYVNYRGEGYWNLRAGTNPADFRRESPNFIQKSSTGYGYEASLGLIYEFSENAELSAGYRYMYLYANNGTDTVFFADGSEGKSNLDWVMVARHGAYAEFIIKF